MATNNIATLKTRSDPWQEALELLAKEKQIYPVDNLMLVSKVLDNYPKRKEYVLDTVLMHDSTSRRLRIMDKHDKVLLELTDLELIDGKIYVRVPYRPRVSWYHWLCSRLMFSSPRGPSVNVHVRR
jgi:hypothetical protein